MTLGCGNEISVQGMYDTIVNALEAIKRQVGEIGSKIKAAAHVEELTFVFGYVLCALEHLRTIGRRIDLGTVSNQLYQVASCLELHLANRRSRRTTATDEAWRGIYSRSFPQLRSNTEEFRTSLSFAKTCRSLRATLNKVNVTLTMIVAAGATDKAPDESTPLQRNVPYDHLFHPSADRLFEAISRKCHRGQEIRLRLGTLQPMSPPENDRCLDILFQNKEITTTHWSAFTLHSHPRHVWMRKRKVNFVDIDATENDGNSWRLENPCKMSCLCSHIAHLGPFYSTYLQHVELDDRKRWQVHELAQRSVSECHSEEYNLAEVFDEIEFTEVTRVVLAMQLAHALSYYYGGEWLLDRWQEANISFFRQGSRVPCEPWLRISLPDNSINTFNQQLGDSTVSQLASKGVSPQLLKLGVLMLELHLGQSLESFLERFPARHEMERWSYANDAFKILNAGCGEIMLIQYRQAIQFCLQPQKTTNNASQLREAIYNKVVLPLQQALQSNGLSHKALKLSDMRLNKRTLRAQGLSARELSALARDAADCLSAQAPTDDHMKLFTVSGPKEDFIEKDLIDEAAIEEGFHLFGYEKLTEDKDRADDSDAWIKSLKKVIIARIGENKTRRIKVALLDTGIDLNHTHFAGEYPTGRIQSIRSWVDDKDGEEDPKVEDESGHGTFIAALLLDLGPSIELYIARISKSNEYQRGTALNVAKALRYAQGCWDVDIITMSFGFSEGIRAIQKEIDRVMRREKSILMFAAASNAGRNRKCKSSRFNPEPRKDQNLSILGEHIKSAWLTKDGGAGHMQRLSGTSFATPIVVCLAAFLMTYVPEIIPDHDELLYKVNSYDGMREMLQVMVASDSRSEQQYLAVDRFFHDNSHAMVVEMIRKALNG